MHTFGTIQIGAPAAPANNGTVVLFDSTTLKVGLHLLGVTRVRLSFPGMNQASAADGLKGYKSTDKGANWYAATFSEAGAAATLPATVAADTGSDSSSYDIPVLGERDVKFTFTAGATAPTIWAPIITLQVGNPQSGSL